MAALAVSAPALAMVATLAMLAPSLAAQEPAWNDERTTRLIARAVERRAQQLADTGLVDYQAVAHGYLTFLAQMGEGFTEPPKIVKADELALEVYWRAPNLSKQRVVGRRDTLLLPTDIDYHRDHLGIVQNNFPDIIRLGDGDEVRDVPHPLSPAGLLEYDFAVADSLRIRFPDRAVDVIQVKVRPKDDRKPRVIGAVYIDRAEGQVVRMMFSFTRAAYLDKALDDLSIVLENGLVGARFWLPRRQEIEIRRTGTWLDYPVRGIIRGRWEISSYDINKGLNPRLFAGPEIVQAPPQTLAAHPWRGAILDSLPPDVRAVTEEDVKRVQDEARTLVRAQALSRTRATSLSARGISDLVRVTRAEGLALGAGLTRRLGGGLSVAAGGRWGFDDREGKGRLALGWQRANGFGLRGSAYREYVDAGDEPERSRVVNSIAAQEFGSDYSDPYDVRGGALALDWVLGPGLLWRLEGAAERQRAVGVAASPARGAFEPTIPAWTIDERRVTLSVSRPTALALLGTEVRSRLELRTAVFDRLDLPDADDLDYARASLAATIERPLGRRRLVARLLAAGAFGGSVPPQAMVYLGGPTTAPGYDFHALAGRLGASGRAEWRTPIPFPAIPLGRYGNTGRAATMAPYVGTAYLARPAAFRPTEGGWYPSAGVGVLTLFDLVRFDVARGLRDGRWSFSVDVGRDFWGIL